MITRAHRAFMAALILLFAGLHPVAAAAPVVASPTEVEASPCHETAAPKTAAPRTAAPETAAPRTAAPETAAPERIAAEQPADADCCPGSCDGQCAPAAAFFVTSSAARPAVHRLPVDATGSSRAPDAAALAAERPPRPVA